MELERAARLVVDDRASDIGGQQVGRELDASELSADGFGNRAGERRLAHAGDVLDEQVSAAEQSDNHQAHGVAFAQNHLFDGACDGMRLFGDLARLRLREPGCGLLNHRGKCTYLDTPGAYRL